MSSSASTDTFPGLTIAPEAALHRALQERTDELERVREAAASVERTLQRQIYTLTRERDEARAKLAHFEAERAAWDAFCVEHPSDEAKAQIEAIEAEHVQRRAAPAAPTAPDVGPTDSAPAAGAADPPRTPVVASERARAWAATVFGEGP